MKRFKSYMRGRIENLLGIGGKRRERKKSTVIQLSVLDSGVNTVLCVEPWMESKFVWKREKIMSFEYIEFGGLIGYPKRWPLYNWTYRLGVQERSNMYKDKGVSSIQTHRSIKYR